MGKRIERAGGEIVKILEQAIEKWHEELVAEKIIVAVLMVHPELDDDGLPKGPALKQNGLPVAGLAKIATPRERVLAGIDGVGRFGGEDRSLTVAARKKRRSRLGFRRLDISTFSGRQVAGGREGRRGRMPVAG